MGLSEKEKALIKSVADNNLQQAKIYAESIVEEEKSIKNKQFCESIKSRLKNQGLNMHELPYNIKTLAVFEDIQNTFNEERYYLPDSEKQIYEKICTKQKVYGYMESLGVPMINTTLLYGESGTGKTMLGKYIAYKLGKPFLYLKFSDCIDSMMGKTAKNISLIFDFAREHDCVLMLDEIDTVATRRKGGLDQGADGETNRITVTLMQEFDRLPAGTVVIAATNRLDRMDEAFLRRFIIKHEVKRLDYYGRKQIVERFYKSINLSVPFDIEVYAEQNKTQAEISNDMVEMLAEYIEKEVQNESVNVIHKSHHRPLEMVGYVTKKICTGKRDKEGTPLFVGDVIENDKGLRFEIRFGEFTMYCPVDDCMMENVGFFCVADGYYEDMPLGPTEQYAKKIGNIYDNPELAVAAEYRCQAECEVHAKRC